MSKSEQSSFDVSCQSTLDLSRKKKTRNAKGTDAKMKDRAGNSVVASLKVIFLYAM